MNYLIVANKVYSNSKLTEKQRSRIISKINKEFNKQIQNDIKKRKKAVAKHMGMGYER